MGPDFQDAYCTHLIDHVKKIRGRIFENKKRLEKADVRQKLRISDLFRYF